MGTQAEHCKEVLTIKNDIQDLHKRVSVLEADNMHTKGELVALRRDVSNLVRIVQDNGFKTIKAVHGVSTTLKDHVVADATERASILRGVVATLVSVLMAILGGAAAFLWDFLSRVPTP